MANKTVDVMAVCPFYEGEGKKTITCEGAIGVRCLNTFETVSDKIKHELAYCCRNYKNCALAKTLLDKYGE